MKTKLLTLLVLASMLIATRAVAQSFYTTNDAHICYEFVFPSQNTYDIIHYYTLANNADTVINATTYKKIYRKEPQQSPLGTLHYCARYDSITKRVYVVFNDSINEHLYYDFKVQLGDTLHNLKRIDFRTNYPYTSTYFVSQVDTSLGVDIITLFNTDNTSPYPNPVLYWYRNIGSEELNIGSVGPVSGWNYLFCVSDTTIPFYANNTCIKNTNELNVLNDEVLTLTPNPAQNFVLINGFTNVEKIKVYDMNGLIQTINYTTNINEIKVNTEHLTSGIYAIQLITNKGYTIKKIIIFK